MTEAGAFVAVTQGLLDMMDEQELEGVLAHEVSHIIHRDIMLNQLVVGLISVILILAVILERVLLLKSIHGDRRDRNDNGGSAIAILILVAILIRPLAILIAQLLQMAISRKREFAADAEAVRLCSYNGKEYTKKEVESLGGRELACMYINFPGGELFSTHPPIEERVRVLRSMY